MFSILKNVNSSLTKATGQLQLQQQVRWMRYRKPPSAPRAKSKRFYVNIKKERDPEEAALSKELWMHYKANMRSIYQLFKAENKFMGQKSEKVRLEKERKVEEEAKLLSENKRLNQTIFEKQMADLQIRLQEEATLKQQKLLAMKEKDELLKQAVERKIKDLEEKSKRFIDPNNLEYEIEKMLNERVDYNFFIDSKGIIYRDDNSNNQNNRRLDK